jgi:DNA-binding NtrC family response regulator
LNGVYLFQNIPEMNTIDKLKIFLVDDDPFCLNLYQQYLNSIRYDDITCFNNGPDCLNFLIQQPDIIFLDHGMDNLSGLEVLKKIKRFNPDIYVVFLSGQENIATAVSALKYGAFDYIVKGDEQLENIAKVLGKVSEIKELLKVKRPGLIGKLFTFL